MIDLTIGCGLGHPEPRPARLLAGVAGLRHLLGAIGRHLHHSRRDGFTGQPITEIDARLLRDIGLSECAAARAVACAPSLGIAAYFPMAGLDPCLRPFPRQFPDRLCAHVCPQNGLCQCRAQQTAPTC